MAKLSDLRFLVQPDVKDCPSFLIDKALLINARELMAATHIWHANFPIATAADNARYLLNVSTITGAGDAAFVRVLYAYVRGETCEMNRVEDLRQLATTATGKPHEYGSDDGAYIQFKRIPDQVYNIDVMVALKLRLADPAGALVLPDSVFEQTGEAIAKGAAGSLMLETGVTWSDPPNGALKKTEFEADIASLRAQVDGLFVRANTRARSPHRWTG